jgi:pyruvate dehydrogenase E1 component
VAWRRPVLSQSRTKDIDDVDFSTGSVGLGVAITSFASIVQDYIKAKEWGGICRLAAWLRWWATRSWTRAISTRRCRRAGRTICATPGGSSTTTASRSTASCMKGLFRRVEKIFEAFGWDVVRVKYGVLQRAAFSEKGGDKLQAVDRQLPQPALRGAHLHGRGRVAQAADGRPWRPGRRDRADRVAQRQELAELMENLGGNCVSTMADAFASIDHDRPTCFLAYTIKGWGTPIAGHKDNHGGLMNKAQMAEWQRHMGVPEGEEWEKFATVEGSGRTSGVPRPVPFFAKGRRRYSDDVATPQCRIAHR